MKFLFLLLLFVIANCSFKKGSNQTQNGHEELYSEPQTPKANNLSPDVKRIVIAATNDIQGHYSPHTIHLRDSHSDKKHSIQIGGVDVMANYFEILREKYQNVLLLDSGDIFSDKPSELGFTQDFYAALNYDAITLGLTDFNISLPQKYNSSSAFFKDFAKKSKTPLILSNLYDLKTARLVEWHGTLPYLLKEVDGVKVGIVGLIPDDIVAQTPVDNRVGLYLENMLQATLRHSRLLRSLGADIIVVLTHQGIDCGEKISEQKNIPLSKVNFDPAKSDFCNMNSLLGDYLQRLPPHLVDVVIGGRNHQKVANYINHTLVLSSFGEGKSFSYAEFFFDSKTKKLLKEKTEVHQPVMFCREFFKETNDCYFEDPSVDHEVKVPAKFLGEPVTPDENLKKKFQYYFDKKKTSAFKIKEPSVKRILEGHGAQIAYLNNPNSQTRLVTVKVSGAQLEKILETDFNFSKGKFWVPSPYKVRGDFLNLTVNENAINKAAEYHILSDGESLQNHPILKKLVNSANTISHISTSWNSEIDEVSSIASSIEY